VGYGLVDSPVGQLAWIVEKFWAWSDCDATPKNVFSRDELLDNVMVYWVTGTAAPRPACIGRAFGVAGGDRVELPTGVAASPGTAGRPAQLVRARLQHHALDGHARGGHFAAFEQPELFRRGSPQVLRDGALTALACWAERPRVYNDSR